MNKWSEKDWSNGMMDKWINEDMRLTIFAEVWNFRKAGKHYSNNPIFRLSNLTFFRDLNDLMGVTTDNVFAIKVSYWMGK